MKQGVVWALFNGSDIAVKPWADAGYLCFCFNAEGADHGSYAEVVEEHPNIQYIDYWIDPWFPDLIKPRDAYPKLTCGWLGNGFVVPEKRPVPQICDVNGYSFQHTKLGGKSPRTKMIRSLTPRGWALAVFEANEPVVRSKLNG